MDYLDFEVHFESAEPWRFVARVVSSPAGVGHLELAFPPDVDSLSAREGQGGAAGSIADAGLAARHLDPADASPQSRASFLSSTDPKVLGRQLFSLLFSGRLLELYRESLSCIENRNELGLRIKLCFDAARGDPGILPSLPWELLYDHGFIARDRRTPVVRCLDVSVSEPRAPLRPPLTVFAFASDPWDPAFAPDPRKPKPLALLDELAGLRQAVSQRPDVALHVFAAATLSDLRDALAQDRAHIVQFMGHGEARAGGVLLLQDHRGRATDVRAEELAGLLAGCGSLRLVVLNACETAAAGPAEPGGPASSVASAVLAAGVPAVLAMPLPISDPAAICFSKALWTALAAGEPLEAAVAAARVAMTDADPGSAEWASPILFLGATGLPTEVAGRGGLERGRVQSLLEGLTAEQLERLERSFTGSGSASPGSAADRKARAQCLVAGLDGRTEEDWVRFQEEILLQCSPFSPPFGRQDDILPPSRILPAEWRQEPECSWQLDGFELRSLGLGEVLFRTAPEALQEAATLSWEGLRFRDARLSASFWLPTMAEGGGAGLLLRAAPNRGLVLGCLYKPPQGEPRIEIFQREGTGLLSLGHEEVSVDLEAEIWHLLTLELDERSARLELQGGPSVEGTLSCDLPAGHLGLARLGRGVVRVKDLEARGRTRAR